MYILRMKVNQKVNFPKALNLHTTKPNGLLSNYIVSIVGMCRYQVWLVLCLFKNNF
jgi:hypothetical protein